MPLRHVLIRIGFVSTAGIGGRIRDSPTSIRYTQLRKPTKGANCNGMYRELSTEPRLSVVVHTASQADLHRWERQIPSSHFH